MILVDLFQERVLGRATRRSIPTMDGPWRPNDALEQCHRLSLDVPEPTGLAWSPDGTLFIASGRQVLKARGPAFDAIAGVIEFGGAVRSIAWHPAVGLAVAVSGEGVRIRADREGAVLLSETATRPIRHPTGVAIAVDGSVFVTEGSAEFAGEDWVRDLMSKNRGGRLVRFAPKSVLGDDVATGLAFPSSVVLDGAGAPIITEAWRHRVVRFASGSRDVLLDNLPGYPGGLVRDADGWWLSLFAPRSHIVEFVLEEDKFRRRMMDAIDPRFWIAPSTDPREHHFQPVQVGSLRSQNIKKPWAPARSYGMVARLNGNFEVEQSFHSRGNGRYHGTGAITLAGGRILVAAQGAHAILAPQSLQGTGP